MLVAKKNKRLTMEDKNLKDNTIVDNYQVDITSMSRKRYYIIDCQNQRCALINIEIIQKFDKVG